MEWCVLDLLFRPVNTNGCVVVITAMPFFLSRLSESPLRSTFASYLTTSFTFANFLFLAHATATSKQVCHLNFGVDQANDLTDKAIPAD